MDAPRELYEVELRSDHQPTGKTRHELNGVLLPPPVLLRIVQYDGDPGYYLFYCDETGCEMTDTYHDSVEQAMAQANWEFNVKAEEWTRA